MAAAGVDGLPVRAHVGDAIRSRGWYDVTLEILQDEPVVELLALNGISSVPAAPRPLDVALARLAAATGITTDPAIVAGLAHVDELVAGRNAATGAPNKAVIVDQLAAGTMTPAQAVQALSTMPTASDDEVRRATLDVMRSASLVAYRNVVAAAQQSAPSHHAALAKAAARSLDKGDERSWRAVHEAGVALRDVGVLPGVSEWGPEHASYMFGDPETVHLWRLEHAAHVRRRASVPENASGVGLICRTPVVPPVITFDVILQHREEWQPGHYSAAESVASMGRWWANAQHARGEG